VIADSDDIMKIFGTETREIFYVAQENMELLERNSAENKLIRNRLIGDYYKGYDPLTGKYIPKEKFLFMFPDDRKKDSVMEEQQQQLQQQEKETEDLLVRIHGAFRDPLVQSHEAAKLSSVNTLPTNDFLRRFGGFFHSSKLIFCFPSSSPYLTNTLSALAPIPPSVSSSSTTTPITSSSSSPSSPSPSVPLLSNSSLIYLLQTCSTRAESETLTHIFWNLWMSSTSIDASRGLREGLNHLSRNNSSQARHYFQNALIHDPSLTEAYNKMATFESMEKHYVTCLKYSLQTLQLIPTHYSAHAMTGISLLSMTKSPNSVRYQDALRSLTESLEYNPWSGWLATKLILLRTTSHRKIESVVKRKTSITTTTSSSGSGEQLKTVEPEQDGFVTRTTVTEGETSAMKSKKKKGSLIEFDLIPDSTEEPKGEGHGEGEVGVDEKSEEKKKKDDHDGKEVTPEGEHITKKTDIDKDRDDHGGGGDSR
jgi:tetratricopeptide (TPR) repeat protein